MAQPTASWNIITIALLVMLSLPIASMIAVAAYKMQRLELYGLAITGSILAMLPCHPGFLIGLPIGIWSLVVLMRPEVKAAFIARREGAMFLTPEDSIAEGNEPTRGRHLIVVLVTVVLLLTLAVVALLTSDALSPPPKETQTVLTYNAFIEQVETDNVEVVLLSKRVLYATLIKPLSHTNGRREFRVELSSSQQSRQKLVELLETHSVSFKLLEE